MHLECQILMGDGSLQVANPLEVKDDRWVLGAWSSSVAEIFCTIVRIHFTSVIEAVGLKGFLRSACGFNLADALDNVGLLFLCHLMKQRKDDRFVGHRICLM